MAKRTSILKSRRRGAAAVEMALVFPVFVMLVFGIVEFGRAMMAINILTNCAREGARAAVLDGSTNAAVTTTIQTCVNSALGVAASNVTVTITTTPGAGNTDPANVIANCKSGDLVTVRVQVGFNQVALIPGNYLSGKQLTSLSTMRHE